MDWLVVALLVLLLLAVGLLASRLRGPGAAHAEALEQVRAHVEALSTALRDMEARQRQADDLARQALDRHAAQSRDELARLLQQGRAEQQQAAQAARGELAGRLEEQLRTTLQRLDTVRGTLDTQLAQLRQESQAKLDQMRGVVDQHLQQTLQVRLDSAFQAVSQRLEQVHQGLGEMQAMAQDVGGLKRALTNVKTRGVLGELQLEAILDEFLTPEQVGRNVETVPGSNKRVEFAVRMPGRDDHGGRPLWLPVDAKFPKEDYERLLDAQDRADREGVEAAGKALEAAVRGFARDVREKYVDPPHTTDFAILFVPTEGLYAELLRRPGLAHDLHARERVMLSGPTTLAATLQSLQMGFRTLALEKRSSEVWTLLGAVKAEFGKFAEVLEKAQDAIASAARHLDSTGTRTRAIERRLRNVQQLPSDQAALLLPPPPGAAGEGEA